tara:strand:- start:86389 stop:87576 length:1188 start_codon:yes stop_codon:yes gene_type:complete
MRSKSLAALLLLLLASPALADDNVEQPEAAEDVVAPAGLAADTAAPAEKKPKPTDLDNAYADDAAAKKTSWRWTGRVFVGNTTTRQELAGQTFWRSKQSVGSARLGLRYTHKSGTRAVIKFEFEDDEAELKDAYVRLSPLPSLRIMAGRFKRPISAIGLAGRWDLPTIERGLLDSVRVEGQDLPFVGGRDSGLVVEYAVPVPTDPKLSVGVFQNDLGKGSSSLDASEHFAQDVYLRASLEPAADLEVASVFALFGYLKETGDPDSFSHAPVGSFEVSYQPRWLRLWAEAFVGTSMFAKADGSTTGNFFGARALVAANVRTGTPRRLQPFAGLSYFDPRQNASEDANTEIQGGVNLAFTKIWRLQFEVGHVLAEGDSSSATTGTAFRVQLGARFKD